MSYGVEFEEDKFEYSPQNKPQQAMPVFQGGVAPETTTHTGMVGWLIKKGIVKSENAGKFILLAVIGINILITAIVIKFAL